MSISPMWLTSNRPAALRTALCSSITPEYWTGISHPPKSTIRAPRALWTEFSGVARSEDAAGMKFQAISTEKGVSTNEDRGFAAEVGEGAQHTFDGRVRNREIQKEESRGWVACHRNCRALCAQGDGGLHESGLIEPRGVKGLK